MQDRHRPEYVDMTEYLAECFWPGVDQTDLIALDERANASADQMTADGEVVRYIGSLLMRQDEVVLCRFEGSELAVRRVAELAAIPFERILEAGHSPWRSDAAAAGLEPTEGHRDAPP